jgi:thioredoxin 1
MKRETLNHEIEHSNAILLYFYNDQCAPCQALRPKVTSLIENSFPEIRLLFINASADPELTSSFNIFGAPTLLVFFEGKEVIRESKFVSVDALGDKISRYYQLMFE